MEETGEIHWNTQLEDILSREGERALCFSWLHAKSQARFSGDGGNVQQWMAWFGEMTNVGEGVLDLKNILAAAKVNGMEHFIIEQDIVKNPEVALKICVDNFKKLV
jgi:sugar phosphate isomerase/epimerase